MCVCVEVPPGVAVVVSREGEGEEHVVVSGVTTDPMQLDR